MFIKSSNLFESHGKTEQQINEGDVPIPIQLILTTDGMEGQSDSSIQLQALRIIDESIASKYKIKNGQQSLMDKIQSCMSCLILSILKGSENADNLFLQNYANFAEAQRLNEENEYLTFKVPDGSLLYFKFDFVFPMDKKAQCAASCSGGSSYNCEEFCILCPCKNYIKGAISFFQCNVCHLKNRVCYCTEVFDAKEREKYLYLQNQEKYKNYMVEFPKNTDLRDKVHDCFLNVCNPTDREYNKHKATVNTMMTFINRFKEANLLDPLEIDRKGTQFDQKVINNLKLFGINDVVMNEIWTENIDTLRRVQQKSTCKIDNKEFECYHEPFSEIDTKFKRRCVLKFVYTERWKLLHLKHLLERKNSDKKFCHQNERFIPCTLHLIIRIGGGKLLTEVLKEIDEINRDERLKSVNNFIHNVFRNLLEEMDNYTIHI